jgi:hypothetical protein
MGIPRRQQRRGHAQRVRDEHVVVGHAVNEEKGTLIRRLDPFGIS